MRKSIGIYGANDESLQLIVLLEENPEVEIASVFDVRAAALRKQLPHLDPTVARTLEAKLTDDLTTFIESGSFYAVIDTGVEPSFATQFPQASERGIQIVTPLMARLLWGYSAPTSEPTSKPTPEAPSDHTHDHKSELLQALREVVESYNLTIDTDELFRRMLEIAIGITGAEGGSLMLLDPATRVLRIRVAVGIEPELWSKIRVGVGEGIAGKVVEEARPLRLRGKADRQTFRIVRERHDVESALCVPLIHEDRVLGVLNLHHSSRPDAFSEADLEFIEQLGRLDAQIIARSQEHESMRSQAARFTVARQVHEILAKKVALPERLTILCRFVSEHAQGGITTIYLFDAADQTMHMMATSMEGGSLGGEYRVGLNEGIDGTVASTHEPSFLHASDGSFAYAALPLLMGEQFAGVLTVQAGPEAQDSRGVRDTLLEIAAAAAEGIIVARREAHITTRATKASAINEAGIRMISATSPAEVLRLGTSGAAMALEADHAILRLQDADTGRYVIRSYFGSADGRQQEKLFRLDKTVSVDVIKSRETLLVREIDGDPRLRSFEGEVRSLIASPLKREDRVVGTLSIYDKVSAERFYTSSFTDEDLAQFKQFVSYLERSVTNALFYAHAMQFRNLDEETGLPNQTYLEKRIHEEIIRSGSTTEPIAVAMCRIENLAEIEERTNAARARKVVQRTVDALRAHLRDFDVLARNSRNEFSVLLPDPGPAAGDRVFALARAVADDVSKDDSLNQTVRVALSFGYALFPEEGENRESLVERAAVPRIRMI
ncbi:MAG: GAF domain-containing protein [Myxococcota bacterium]